jgi:hypothetical protein
MTLRITIPTSAAVLGVLGALTVSANVGATSAGFAAMCACNVLWIVEGRRTMQRALLWMNLAFLAINALGVVRYW